MADIVELPDIDRLIARFKDVPTGLITDAFLRLGIEGWMNGVLPLVPGTRIVGRARTITYGPVRKAGKVTKSMYALIDRLSPGDVLVMGAGETHNNLMGDNMGAFAKRKKLAGVVTDSKTRDRVGLAEVGLPVFSRGAATRPPIEVEVSAYDVPVVCAGAQVRVGDIVVGDDDGVVVVPVEHAEEVLFQVADLMDVEEQMDKAISGGGSLADIEATIARKKVAKKH